MDSINGVITMKEITFELTNYYPERCKFCSSNVVIDKKSIMNLPIDVIQTHLNGKKFDIIHLSGGLS